MLDDNLVEGFSVDTQTHKPDLSLVLNQNKLSNHLVNQLNGELNLENLPILIYGVVSITLINGNNYILFVDDSEKFSTTEFLKLVFKSPVQSDLLSFFHRTETVTGEISA